MLLWLGLILLATGLGCFAVDRRAAHYFHAHISQKNHIRLWRVTDWAKGELWLALTVAVILISRTVIWLRGPSPFLQQIYTISLAYLACLAVGSAILHTLKILMGRRRPRDELEMNLYGFRPFHFDLQSDSFPSGHALTICCVAVIATAVWPQCLALWFAVALYLSFTRAMLNAHFLSDVFIGAGIGILASRETLFYLFPHLFRPWF
ncbi:MAG TPA: phosphatase PAP2 family protein [Rhizomicrobium sp.]|nr:phosphatase PAP2 family protein [Rhizomicrobium sp.]